MYLNTVNVFKYNVFKYCPALMGLIFYSMFLFKVLHKNYIYSP